MNRWGIGDQQPFPERLQCRNFVLVYVVLVALCKTEQKESPASGTVGDNGAISARSPLSRPGDTLLDEAAAQIGID
jgi:hypothetical protein